MYIDQIFRVVEDYILDILVDLEANLGIHGPSYFV